MTRIPEDRQQRILDLLSETVSDYSALADKTCRLLQAARSEQYQCSIAQLVDATGLPTDEIELRLNEGRADRGY